MSEMEDKFQEILGNQQAMGQIMSIAQSLSPDLEGETNASGGGDGLNLEGMLGDMNPKMLAMGMELVSAYQSQHRSTQLMRALRPLVKEERHEMMDRLTQATKFAKVARCLLDMLGKKGDEIVV